MVFHMKRLNGDKVPLQLKRDEGPRLRAKNRMAGVTCKVLKAEFGLAAENNDFHIRRDRKRELVTIWHLKDPVRRMEPESADVLAKFYVWNPEIDVEGKIIINKEEVKKETPLDKGMGFLERKDLQVEWRS